MPRKRKTKPGAGTGVVPPGMSSADFNVSAWRTTKNSVGGRWNWDRNLNVTAGISTTGVTATDALMTAIDAKIDDGDLRTGLFQKFDTRFTLHPRAVNVVERLVLKTLVWSS